MRTVAEAISECRRELQVRRRCFDRWVADGKLDQIEATDRTERLDAAIVFLEDYQTILKDKEASAMPTDEELSTKRRKGSLTSQATAAA